MWSTTTILGLVWLMTSFLPSTSAFSLNRSPGQTLDILLGRSLTCANSTFSSCASVDSKLPGDFCCSKGSTCISLDSSSSVLCCPDGENCKTIQPLSCNVAAQNPVSHPGAGVQTTRLHDSLAVCGSQCCPFGYTCSSQQDICILNEDTSITGSNPSSSSTPTTTASSTTTRNTSTATASGIDSNVAQPITQCPRFPGAAVAAGFFPGLLAGALLMLLGVLFFGPRRPQSRPNSHTSSLYKPRYPIRHPDGTITGVSEPMPRDSQSARTDFLHRTTSRARSFFSTGNDNGQSGYRYPYQENWKMPTPPEQNNIPLEPSGRLVPVTPQRQARGDNHLKTQPSTESIRVYSPQAMSRPAPTVAPLRAMEAQRKQPKRSEIGSPFKTPPTNKYAYPDDPLPDRGETLTPARYDDGRGRDQKDESDLSRPMTTFTEMLGEIHFPDPGRGRAPAVPQVPIGIDWSKKEKRRS